MDGFKRVLLTLCNVSETMLSNILSGLFSSLLLSIPPRSHARRISGTFSGLLSSPISSLVSGMLSSTMSGPRFRVHSCIAIGLLSDLRSTFPLSLFSGIPNSFQHLYSHVLRLGFKATLVNDFQPLIQHHS